MREAAFIRAVYRRHSNCVGRTTQRTAGRPALRGLQSLRDVSTRYPPRSTDAPDTARPLTTTHAPSYYAASAHDSPTRPTLEGEYDVDVCIVGAGFTGLSAALHLAAAGRQVVVLEAARVGWGASGRNGGQIVNGLNAGLDTIERRYGADTAGFVGGLLQEGAGIIRGFVAEHRIDCDLKSLNVYTALNTRHLAALEAKLELWGRFGMHDHELLDRNALGAHVQSDRYCGGMVDHSGGHLHPLNLALGEAAAFERLGGVIHEHTRVTEVRDVAGDPVVQTERGQIYAGTLLLCGNAYLGDAVPQLAPRVLPCSTQMVATENLDESTAAALMPSDACVEDCRYILDYFRLSGDRRLLFGGGSIYGGATPADIEGRLRKNLEKVFPSLKGIGIDYAWSGNFALSFSRVPQLGQLGPNAYHAMGYSGHGVTGSHLFGRLLGEAVSGHGERFEQFARLPWYPFPGGQRFRAQYSTIGSWWYGLRDAVGY